MTLEWEACVVGINYYFDNNLPPLTAAANDAEAIAFQLQKFGYQSFRVQRLPRQSNQKGEGLVDPNKRVKAQELQEAIANLFTSNDNPPETALFFFSGHGWLQPHDNKKELFLATSDAFIDANDQNNSEYGVPISFLVQSIRESKAQNVVVWLDCCHSGELIQYFKENPLTDKNYCIITATRSYEKGIETDTEGLFTQSLREGLKPSNYSDGIANSHKLVKFIQEGMKETAQAPQSLISKTPINLTKTLNKCPYRSLFYFTEKQEDAEVFKGRTKLTQDLVKRVRDKERLIAVFGASGSGKSSLIRAGLLYQLKLGKKIAGSDKWCYFDPFTPTDDPLARLKQILPDWLLNNQESGNILLPSSKLTELSQDLESSNPNLESSNPNLELSNSNLELSNSNLELSNSNLESRNTSERDARTPEGKRKDYQEKDGITPIILIIDQFEECFTMCDEEKRKKFINKLTELIETKPNLNLIIGMRSDFRGRLREYPQFAKKMSKLNVDHLNRKEIQEAIEKPAEWVGLGIEGSLKQQLINDVEDYPGSLPLLQYTLTELWNEARNQGEWFLRLETYEKLGGIEGTLERRAEQVYKNLELVRLLLPLITLLHKSGSLRSPTGLDVLEFLFLLDYQKVAKRIFLELTQVGNTFDARRRVTLGDLENSRHPLGILNTVTQTLANEDNRLITYTEAQKANVPIKFALCLLKINCLVGMLFLQGFHTDGSKTQIDVVHEALIRHWKRLVKWKEKYQNGMVIERRIEELAQEWEKGGRKNEELYPASKLGIVEGYLKEFEEWGMLDGMAEKFIDESRKQVGRRKWGIAIALILFVLAIILGFKIKYDTDDAVIHMNEVVKEAKKDRDDANSKTVEAEKKREVAEKKREVAEKERDDANSNTSTANNSLKNIISVLIKNSQELLEPNTGKEFDALLTSLNAAKLLNFLPLEITSDKKLLKDVEDALRNAVSQVTERNRLEGHKGAVNSVSFSPDGKQLASGGADGIIKLWDAASGELINTLPGNNIQVNSVSFRKDGILAFGSADGTIKLWNVTTGEVKTLPGNNIQVNSVHFSPDGRLLASKDADGIIKLWDVTIDKNTKPPTQQGNNSESDTISFSRDEQLAFVGTDDTIKLWDVTTDKEPTTIPKEVEGGGIIASVIFSPDGQLLAYSEDHTIHLWDIAKNEYLPLPNLQQGGVIRSLSFSSDGKILASVSGDGDNAIKLWDVATGKEINTLKGHKLGVNSVSFSPTNGNLLASASADGTIKLWDISPHENLSHLNLDDLIGKGCDWVRGYLEHNPNVTDSVRDLRDFCRVKPKKPNATNGKNGFSETSP